MDNLSKKYSHLSAKQLKAVVAYASGSSLSKAADAAGVHRSTIYEWRNNAPDFVEACTDARFLAIQALLDRLKGLSALALDTLEGLLTDAKSSASVRLKASLAILNRLEKSAHHGWALPQPIQEADHVSTERDLLHRDQKRTERTEAAKAAAKTPQKPPKSDSPRNLPNLNSLDRPNAPCACGSGETYLLCCAENDVFSAVRAA